MLTDQVDITQWELEHQHEILGWEIDYHPSDYDLISFKMKDKSITQFKRPKQ